MCYVQELNRQTPIRLSDLVEDSRKLHDVNIAFIVQMCRNKEKCMGYYIFSAIKLKKLNVTRKKT